MNMEGLDKMEKSVKRLRERIAEENAKRPRTQMLGVGPNIGPRDAARARAEAADAAAMYAALTHATGETRNQQPAMAAQLAARRTAVARAASRHAVIIHAEMTRALSVHAIAANAAARYATMASMTAGTHAENADTAQATTARAVTAQATARQTLAARTAAVHATAAFTNAARAADEITGRTLASSPSFSPSGDDRYNTAGAAAFSVRRVASDHDTRHGSGMDTGKTASTGSPPNENTTIDSASHTTSSDTSTTTDSPTGESPASDRPANQDTDMALAEHLEIELSSDEEQPPQASTGPRAIFPPGPGGIALYEADLRTLTGPYWVTDTVIDAWAKGLEATLNIR
ncbi:translation initiation factor IF-2-like, partial [Rhagoletis pomonella]|uniref:translation initiation factor IF-2-like n=1 Tax=Rhagoletis pomonella TaxID=28610 RepID=UPI00177F43CC